MPGAKLRITVLITQSGINSAKRLGAGSLFRFGSSLVEYSCFDCLQLPAATSLPTPPYKHHHSADFNLNSFSHIEFHTPSPPPVSPPNPHPHPHPPTDPLTTLLPHPMSIQNCPNYDAIYRPPDSNVCPSQTLHSISSTERVRHKAKPQTRI